MPSQGTGLGSSSSYTVGLLQALYRYARRDAGPEQLARDACCVEIARCGQPIGKQDQYIAAYGGLKYLQFHPDDSVSVDPIVCTRETREVLESHLLLLYTGITRASGPILAEQQRDLSTGGRKRDMLRRMARLAGELRDALAAGEPGTLGDVLHECWMVKRPMAAGVSTTQIDQWYERAHARICRALPSLRRVTFRMEEAGTAIIYAEEGDHD